MARGVDHGRAATRPATFAFGCILCAAVGCAGASAATDGVDTRATRLAADALADAWMVPRASWNTVRVHVLPDAMGERLLAVPRFDSERTLGGAVFATHGLVWVRDSSTAGPGAPLPGVLAHGVAALASLRGGDVLAVDGLGRVFRWDAIGPVAWSPPRAVETPRLPVDERGECPAWAAAGGVAAWLVDERIHLLAGAASEAPTAVDLPDGARARAIAVDARGQLVVETEAGRWLVTGARALRFVEVAVPEGGGAPHLVQRADGGFLQVGDERFAVETGGALVSLPPGDPHVPLRQRLVPPTLDVPAAARERLPALLDGYAGPMPRVVLQPRGSGADGRPIADGATGRIVGQLRWPEVEQAAGASCTGSRHDRHYFLSCRGGGAPTRTWWSKSGAPYAELRGAHGHVPRLVDERLDPPAFLFDDGPCAPLDEHGWTAPCVLSRPDGDATRVHLDLPRHSGVLLGRLVGGVLLLVVRPRWPPDPGARTDNVALARVAPDPERFLGLPLEAPLMRAVLPPGVPPSRAPYLTDSGFFFLRVIDPPDASGVLRVFVPEGQPGDRRTAPTREMPLPAGTLAADFVDSRHGVAVGRRWDRVFRTRDGGDSWQRVPVPDALLDSDTPPLAPSDEVAPSLVQCRRAGCVVRSVGSGRAWLSIRGWGDELPVVFPDIL